jgi:hypothetical protein
VAPYVTTLLYGGNFPWEKENGVATIFCPDPKGISLELKRIEIRQPYHIAAYDLPDLIVMNHGIGDLESMAIYHDISAS